MRFADGSVRSWSELELPPDAEPPADRPAPTAWDRPGVAEHPDRPRLEDIRLTPDRLAHILDGDENGGGHLSGTGEPGESEFPPSWTPDTIADATEHVARNPQDARHQRNGWWLARGDYENVQIWTVVRPDARIWTAWPDPDSPGVIRNPYPEDPH